MAFQFISYIILFSFSIILLLLQQKNISDFLWFWISEGSWRFSFIGQFLSHKPSCWLILGTLTLLLLLVNINYFPGNPWCGVLCSFQPEPGPWHGRGNNIQTRPSTFSKLKLGGEKIQQVFSSEKKTRRKRKARRPIREVLLFLVDYQIIIPRRMRTFPRVRQNGMFLVAGDFYLVWGLKYFLTRWNSSQTGNYDCTSSLALLCSQHGRGENYCE